MSLCKILKTFLYLFSKEKRFLYSAGVESRSFYLNLSVIKMSIYYGTTIGGTNAPEDA